jgi:hypothetical protein
MPVMGHKRRSTWHFPTEGLGRKFGRQTGSPTVSSVIPDPAGTDVSISVRFVGAMASPVTQFTSLNLPRSPAIQYSHSREGAPDDQLVLPPRWGIGLRRRALAVG